MRRYACPFFCHTRHAASALIDTAATRRQDARYAAYMLPRYAAIAGASGSAALLLAFADMLFC